MNRWNGNGIQPPQGNGSNGHAWGPAQDEQDETDALSLLGALARKKWVALGVLLLFMCGGVAYIKLKKPLYESTAEILVVNSVQETPGAPTNDIPLINDLQALTRSRSLNTQVEMISSPEIIKGAYQNVGEATRADGFGETASPPGWAYKIEGIRDTDIIRIKAKAYTPDAAADFANNIASAYFQQGVEKDAGATRKARQFAENNLSAASKTLKEATDDLTAFEERTGFVSPQTQLSKAIDQSATLAMNLDQANADMQARQQAVASIEQQLAKQGETVETSKNIVRNPRLSSIIAKIDELNSQRIALLQEYTPTSPEVQKIDESIKAEEARLEEVTQTVVESQTESRNPIRDSLVTKYATDVADLAAQSARVNALQGAMQQWQTSVQRLPTEERQYLDLAQRVAIAQKTFDTLNEKYRTLLLAEQTMLPKGMLASQAQPATAPQYPSKSNTLAVFTIAGLIAGAMAANWADRRDRRVYTRQAIEAATGLETLAVVPDMTRNSPRLSSYELNSSSLLESFRMLRNSIKSEVTDEPPRLIAVTSACSGEGKSTTALNLAVAEAMDGKKTLLVDLSMRKPHLNSVFSLPNDLGLSSVLRGEYSLEEAIFATTTENVHLLPAGPVVNDCPELIGKPYTRDVLKEAASKYDIVILDCPPCAGVSEMQIIPSMVDMVLLVVSVKKADRAHLYAAAVSLMKAGAPFVGLITNRVNVKKLEAGHISPYCRYAEQISSNGADDALHPKVNAG